VVNTIAVIGRENVGKSLLVRSLSGKQVYSSNYSGSTVSCEVYDGSGHVFIDTPGIVLKSDAQTTKSAISSMENAAAIMLVVAASNINDDLSNFVPLLLGKPSVLVITFWDKIENHSAAEDQLRRLEVETGLKIVAVDARVLSPVDKARILSNLQQPRVAVNSSLSTINWTIKWKPTVFHSPQLSAFLALIFLLLPPILAVWGANSFAEAVDPYAQATSKYFSENLSEIPSDMLRAVLIGRYGLITMGPLLLLWAGPTVLLYSLIMAAYKASGILERISYSLDHWTRGVGLHGKDIVRVIMGFGCNVPAVINTRACSSCTRGTCIKTIAFGSACSYQFGATLSVFSAADQTFLVYPYLFYLVATSLLYARLVGNLEARSPFNNVLIPFRSYLEVPTISRIWVEAKGDIGHFIRKALPIFFAITIFASVLDYEGIVQLLSDATGPFMTMFNLPSQTSLPMILAAIRKDAIILIAERDLLGQLNSAQILTAVYLSGVLLPCLVTTITIIREQSFQFASRLVLFQLLAAIVFSAFLAWGQYFLWIKFQ
jgi:Fe2+ transport system protein B